MRSRRRRVSEDVRSEAARLLKEMRAASQGIGLLISERHTRKKILKWADRLEALLASLGQGEQLQVQGDTRVVDSQYPQPLATASTVTPSASEGTKEPEYFPFAIERKDPADTCGGCGGPYAWDTTIQSEVWNRVVRPLGISEYLCTNCILRLFAARGEGFSAELWGGRSGVDFNGLPLHVGFSELGRLQTMESARSDLRGDQGAPRTSSDDTRAPDSSAAASIHQVLITALKDVKHELFWLDCVCATPGGSVDLAQTLRLAGVLRKTIKALKLAALAFAETGEP
jgi:hypothetical protein